MRKRIDCTKWYLGNVCNNVDNTYLILCLYLLVLPLSESLHCDKKHHENTLERFKILPAIESSMKLVDNKIKQFKKKTQSYCHNVVNDLSNFDEMVLKKKNPYADLKEMELKYYNGKNSRQIVDPGVNLVEEPVLCEQENGINVEIINRGLSGFTVPAKLLKNVGVLAKVNIGQSNLDNDLLPAISKQQPTRRNPDVELLSALEDDIKQFAENKAVNS